jgi:hypothetical protein
VQEVDEFYMTEEQEDVSMLKAIEEGKKEGRMTNDEQNDLREWIRMKAEESKMATA